MEKIKLVYYLLLPYDYSSIKRPRYCCHASPLAVVCCCQAPAAPVLGATAVAMMALAISSPMVEAFSLSAPASFVGSSVAGARQTNCNVTSATAV